MCLRQIVWALAYVAATESSEDTILYCYSEVEAAFYHPSEVPEWICAFRSTSPGFHVF